MRSYNPNKIGCYEGWERYAGNPVINERIGESSDPVVFRDAGKYRMYYTHRFLKKILMAVGENGLEFRPFAEGAVSEEETEAKSYIVGDNFYADGGDFGYTLTRRAELKWESAVCQPFVLKKDLQFHLFYVGKHYDLKTETYDGCSIGHAVSKNGRQWKARREPVLVPDKLWERNAVGYPSVSWDEKEKIFKMWYSGGSIEKPTAIGYAVSKDGDAWEKRPDPVFERNNTVLEKERVGACHVIQDGEWYYMFYTAWQDEFKSRICLARSKNGIDSWERHKSNPIITWGQFGAWDVESVYRPFAVKEDGRWLCYYTGCARKCHRIGVLIHEGNALGF